MFVVCQNAFLTIPFALHKRSYSERRERWEEGEQLERGENLKIKKSFTCRHIVNWWNQSNYRQEEWRFQGFGEGKTHIREEELQFAPRTNESTHNYDFFLPLRCDHPALLFSIYVLLSSDQHKSYKKNQIESFDFSTRNRRTPSTQGHKNKNDNYTAINHWEFQTTTSKYTTEVFEIIKTDKNKASHHGNRARYVVETDEPQRHRENPNLATGTAPSSRASSNFEERQKKIPEQEQEKMGFWFSCGGILWEERKRRGR